MPGLGAKKKWTVWFDQVNQTMYEVSAETEMQAIFKARKLWKEEFGEPLVAEVEKE